MFTGQVIGYLGADARTIQRDDKTTICFNVSSNVKIGEEEKTTWVSCFYNRNSKVVEYLKKGVMVYVSGDITVDLFKKDDGTYIPNITMNVSKLELCGSSSRKE
jgi:single-stranded DNA-binding protein